MVTQKLPAKGKTSKGIDQAGLQKRPQMEQIINHFENGQERTHFPDGQASFFRNHPFMAQPFFFLKCRRSTKTRGQSKFECKIQREDLKKEKHLKQWKDQRQRDLML
jgi:hypothetical protein